MVFDFSFLNCTGILLLAMVTGYRIYIEVETSPTITDDFMNVFNDVTCRNVHVVSYRCV